MKVQIWSDVMCPFCYIGKRRFEEALSKFEYKDEVEVEWKSFQLNPAMKTNTSISIDQYLADAKGWQLDYAQQLNKQVTEMAAQVGLTYNFDRAVVANSFNAHRFTHLAKKHNLGEAAEEQLFKAYFTEGKNIDDAPTLMDLATGLGLDAKAFAAAMGNGDFTNDVIADIQEAQALGIQGVPFFVFDRKYAVSGAQDPATFLETLETVVSGE